MIYLKPFQITDWNLKAMRGLTKSNQWVIFFPIKSGKITISELPMLLIIISDLTKISFSTKFDLFALKKKKTKRVKKVSLPKHDAKRKYFKEHGRSDGQVFFFTRHSKRSKGEGSVIEGQLKSHMDGVEKNFFPNKFDLNVFIVKVSCDFPYLTHRVVHKPSSFTSVVKS